MFIENQGQYDAQASFYLHGVRRDIWLVQDDIWVMVREAENATAAPGPLAEADRVSGFDPPRVAERPVAKPNLRLKISFPGANPHPRMEAIDRLDTHVSYFIGADPAKWRTDVPVWGGVRYADLYPGVDLEVSGQASAWDWRLRAGPGAAVDQVGLRVEGADGLRLDGDQLRVSTGLGEFSLPLMEVEGARPAGQRPALQGDTCFRHRCGALTASKHNDCEEVRTWTLLILAPPSWARLQHWFLFRLLCCLSSCPLVQRTCH